MTQRETKNRVTRCEKSHEEQSELLCVLPAGHGCDCIFVSPPVRIRGTMR